MRPESEEGAPRFPSPLVEGVLPLDAADEPRRDRMSDLVILMQFLAVFNNAGKR